MKWVPAIWTALVLTLVIGCTQGPTAGLDPFGRTTIPSPATRAAQVPVVVPSQVDPYYSGNVSTAPMVPVGPRTSSNSATPSLAPPTLAATGGAPDTWRSPAILNPANTNTSGRLQPVSPGFLASNPAGSTQVASNISNPGSVRRATYVEEDGQLIWREPAGGSRTTISPGTTNEQPRVEIGNLPPATAQGTNSILRTSQAAPANGVANVASAAVSRYGFSHDYRWLKGQLEYSAPQRQWKLRYIPSDGQPDRFGGSVALDSVAELSQFRHGDFIQVQGVVSATNPNAPSATSYRISRIARLP